MPPGSLHPRGWRRSSASPDLGTRSPRARSWCTKHPLPTFGQRSSVRIRATCPRIARPRTPSSAGPAAVLVCRRYAPLARARKPVGRPRRSAPRTADPSRSNHRRTTSSRTSSSLDDRTLHREGHRRGTQGRPRASGLRARSMVPAAWCPRWSWDSTGGQSSRCPSRWVWPARRRRRPRRGRFPRLRRPRPRRRQLRSDPLAGTAAATARPGTTPAVPGLRSGREVPSPSVPGPAWTTPRPGLPARARSWSVGVRVSTSGQAQAAARTWATRAASPAPSRPAARRSVAEAQDSPWAVGPAAVEGSTAAAGRAGADREADSPEAGRRESGPTARGPEQVPPPCRAAGTRTAHPSRGLRLRGQESPPPTVR